MSGDSCIAANDVQNEAKKEISRRHVRALIFHVLYMSEAWNYESSVEAIIDNLNRGFDTDITFEGDIAIISSGVISARDELDAAMKPLLAHWRIERLGMCTRLILRLAIWEYLHTDTVPEIIINEAIQLAKCFAEKDAYGFINGVLDELVERDRKNVAEE